jgi:hypothetical protein
MAKKNIMVRKSVNLRDDVVSVIEAECEKKRNGDNGFSLTLNQIVLKWLDFQNTECGDVDTRELQNVPAVRTVDLPDYADVADEKKAGG